MNSGHGFLKNISLYTTEGKMLKTTKDLNISISNSGVYFIKVETVQGTTFQKVVVE